jgi:Leucine-rich repeat (LRR) protein
MILDDATCWRYVSFCHATGVTETRRNKKSCLIAITHSPIFTQYQDLIANDNLLKTFPASIIGCAALNTCDLRNNLLTSVPCELGSLVTMRALFLEGGWCWLFAY